MKKKKKSRKALLRATCWQRYQATTGLFLFRALIQHFSPARRRRGLLQAARRSWSAPALHTQAALTFRLWSGRLGFSGHNLSEHFLPNAAALPSCLQPQASAWLCWSSIEARLWWSSKKRKNPQQGRGKVISTSFTSSRPHKQVLYLKYPLQAIGFASVAIFVNHIQNRAFKGHQRNKRQFILFLLQFNTVFDTGEAAVANMQSN